MVTFGQLPSCYFQKANSIIIMKVDILRVDILESNLMTSQQNGVLINSLGQLNPLTRSSETVQPWDMFQWDNVNLKPHTNFNT